MQRRDLGAWAAGSYDRAGAQSLVVRLRVVGCSDKKGGMPEEIRWIMDGGAGSSLPYLAEGGELGL